VDTQPDPVDAQTDQMLSEEQPGTPFVPEMVPFLLIPALLLAIRLRKNLDS
jgi:hypothetical protein